MKVHTISNATQALLRHFDDFEVSYDIVVGNNGETEHSIVIWGEDITGKGRSPISRSVAFIKATNSILDKLEEEEELGRPGRHIVEEVVSFTSNKPPKKLLTKILSSKDEIHQSVEDEDSRSDLRITANTIEGVVTHKTSGVKPILKPIVVKTDQENEDSCSDLKLTTGTIEGIVSHNGLMARPILRPLIINADLEDRD